MRTKIGLLLILLLPTLLFAQKETEADTVIADKIGWMAYPYAFYTPETQLAFGAGALVYFRTTTKQPVRPSKILLSGYYTTNNQYYIKLAPVIYFPGMDQDIIDVKFIYSKEIGKFYGIGQSTPEFENPKYTMRTWRAYIEYSGFTFVSSSFHTGLIYEYSPNDVIDQQKNKFLINDVYTGSTGGTVAGLGVLMIFDKRDNIFFPTENHLYKIRAQFFGSYFGGDFEYHRWIIDMRQYFSTNNEHIFAFQAYAEYTAGDPPFFRFPALGGDQRMRGYFYGRFRDKIYLMTQAEYRKIVWWRLGVAAFFGMGDVAGDFNKFNTRTLKFSYGAGLRFVFDKEEKINVRCDFGFGKDTSGIYFALEEAF
ncbi:MAG: BamA/TamA family outer membrane protein [Calditrichae bacterium]|nr:BamA/TamA family outer membrane protein [Calditrichia bacterium]